MKAFLTFAAAIKCVLIIEMLCFSGVASGGSGVQGHSTPARAATASELNIPQGLTVSTSDALFISTFRDERIHRLDLKTGLITTLRTQEPIAPGSILTDRSGNLIVANPLQCRVAQINVDDGSVKTIVGRGNGSSGIYTCGSDGDNGPASKAALEPNFITQDVNGNLFIVDGWPNARIRRVDHKSGIITTVVTRRQLQGATTVALNDHGTLFISQAEKDTHRRGILSLDTETGLLNALKSSSFEGNKDIWADTMRERRIFSDPLGNLYLLSESRVFYIDFAKHFVSVVAGTRTKGFSGDGGPATEAQLYWPTSLVLDSTGNIYIADSENQRIRRIDAKTHIITTVAGNGGPPHIPGTIELSQ